MNRLSTTTSAFAFAMTVLLVSICVSNPAWAQSGTQVTVTEVVGHRFVGGFVPTDSGSPVVLCTLNENSPGYGAVRLSGISLLCRQRSGEGYNGVAVLAILPATFQFNQNESIGLTVTVVQSDATWYGEVESCNERCW